MSVLRVCWSCFVLLLVLGAVPSRAEPKLLHTIGNDRMRFPGGIALRLVVSQDNNFIGVQAIEGTTVFELATGRQVWASPSQMFRDNSEVEPAFSPEGNLLLSCTTEDGLQLLRYTLNSTVPFQKLVLDAKATEGSTVFSPDGRLVVLLANPVRIFSTSTGKEVNRIPLDEAESPNFVSFSGNGQRLLILSETNTVRVFDCRTGGQVLRHRSGDGGQVPQFALSHDGEELVLQYDANKLVVFDLNTGKSRRLNTREIHDRLVGGLKTGEVLTVDDGNGYFQIVDTRTGKLRRRIRSVSQLDEVALTPDRKHLVASDSRGRLFVYDFLTGQRLPQSATDREVYELRFLGNGQLLLGTETSGAFDLRNGLGMGHLSMATNDRVYHAYDLKTGNVRVVRAPRVNPPFSLASELSQEGRWYARYTMNLQDQRKGHRLELVDAVSGRVLRSIPFHTGDELPTQIWLKDRDRDVCVYTDRTVYLWNLATYRITKLPLRAAEDAMLVSNAPPTTTKGKWFAETITDEAKNKYEHRVYDLSRNQLTFRLPFQANNRSQIRFMPDGTKLVRHDEPNQARVGDEAISEQLRIHDSATGRLLREISFSNRLFLDISHDGRTLLMEQNPTGIGDDLDNTLLGVEVATGNIRWSHQPKNSSVYAYQTSFSRDGRRLAVATNDGLTSVWDILQIEAEAPTARDAERIGRNLASTDSQRAYETIQQLIAHPGYSLAFLAEKLPPEVSIPEEQVRAWLEELDSPEFRKRERANKRLVDVLPRVRHTIEAMLKKTPSVEVRARLEDMLDSSITPNGPELQRIRGVEIVEQIVRDHPPGHAVRDSAVSLLKSWASGTHSGTLTREAQQALDRLSQ